MLVLVYVAQLWTYYLRPVHTSAVMRIECTFDPDLCLHTRMRIGFSVHSKANLWNHFWSWFRCPFAFDPVLWIDHVGSYPQDWVTLKSGHGNCDSIQRRMKWRHSLTNGWCGLEHRRDKNANHPLGTGQCLRVTGRSDHKFLPENTSSANQNPPSVCVHSQLSLLPSPSISFMLQAQAYAIEQQNNGEHSDHILVGHYFLETSCVTHYFLETSCVTIPHAMRITHEIQKPVWTGIDVHSMQFQFAGIWCAFQSALSVATSLLR